MARFQASEDGIFGSALVTSDTVFFADIGGWIYALNRETGAERWKLNARAKEFPDCHSFNVFFASPILADGKLIVAGGTLEQVVAGFPFYRGCTGRGFVVALDPKTGRIHWKYDLGPKPQPLDPPITINDSWGKHVFYFGPATSSIWSTPSFDADSGTIFFGTDVNTAPRKPTADNPLLDTCESCGVVALHVRDGKEKWVTQINPGDVWTNAMRSYDPKPVFTNVGDLVASGIAVAKGVIYFTTVASGKLVAVDAATGENLKEIDLGPVWSGPSVSRGRVYVGTGNTLFRPSADEAFFPKKYTGVLYSFGLPGEDEVSRLGGGKE
jgi:outer membrane protein assembly factor BamB